MNELVIGKLELGIQDQVLESREVGPSRASPSHNNIMTRAIINIY